MKAGPSLHVARGDVGVDIDAARRAAAEFLSALGIDVDRDDLRETRPGWPAPTPSCSAPSRYG